MSLKKPRPHRDPRYLAWLATKPCLCCGVHMDARVDPHHATTGGVGTKGSDLIAVPLCRRCHDLVQGKKWGELAQWGLTQTVIFEWASRYLADYVFEREEQREADRLAGRG